MNTADTRKRLKQAAFSLAREVALMLAVTTFAVLWGMLVFQATGLNERYGILVLPPVILMLVLFAGEAGLRHLFGFKTKTSLADHIVVGPVLFVLYAGSFLYVIGECLHCGGNLYDLVFMAVAFGLPISMSRYILIRALPKP